MGPMILEFVFSRIGGRLEFDILRHIWSKLLEIVQISNVNKMVPVHLSIFHSFFKFPSRWIHLRNDIFLIRGWPILPQIDKSLEKLQFVVQEICFEIHDKLKKHTLHPRQNPREFSHLTNKKEKMVQIFEGFYCLQLKDVSNYQQQ